mgnify:CR=1 FL=1
MGAPPDEFRWLFWEVDFDALDVVEHADFIIPRVLEFGRLVEVRWAIRTYGLDRLHHFLRDVGHAELSDRTLHFWRALFHAEDERWASPPAWRRSRPELWPG